MFQTSLFKQLRENAPEAVMVRRVLERALEAGAVNQVFENSRDNPYTRKLLFSSVVLMDLVAGRVSRCVSAAFQLPRDRFDVSLKSIYNKQNATDPFVCCALLARWAARMTQVIEELGVPERPLIPGCVPS